MKNKVKGFKMLSKYCHFVMKLLFKLIKVKGIITLAHLIKSLSFNLPNKKEKNYLEKNVR